MRQLFILFILTAVVSSFPQSEDAFGEGETSFSGLLDPSRFSINHSISFGMGGSDFSSLKSQSLYSTMMQYTFNAPVVLRLNFGFPIHSTFSPASNLSESNLQNLDYFRNMPMDVSVAWQPSENFSLHFNFIKQSETSYHHGYYSGARSFYDSYYGRFGSRSLIDRNR